MQACGRAGSRPDVQAIEHPRWLLTFARFGRGDDTVVNTHRAQIYQFEFFEFILLLKLDTAPCRAIRGSGISVNSTLPPLLKMCCRGPGRRLRGRLPSLLGLTRMATISP